MKLSTSTGYAMISRANHRLRLSGNKRRKSYNPVFMWVVGFIFCLDIKLILKIEYGFYNVVFVRF